MGNAKPVPFTDRIARILNVVNLAEKGKRISPRIAQCIRDQLLLAQERSVTAEYHTKRWMTDPLRSALILIGDVQDVAQAIKALLDVTEREPQIPPRRAKPIDESPIKPYTGPTDTQCLYPGCSKPTRTRGYCNTHYGYMRRNNKIYIKRITRAWCTVDGCESGADVDGLCHTHYGNKWRCGTPLGLIATAPECCQVEGCENEPHVLGDHRGYCDRHAAMIAKYGDALHVPYSSLITSGVCVHLKPGQKECSVNGCSAPAVGRGLCMKHWRRKRRAGDFDADLRGH